MWFDKVISKGIYLISFYHFKKVQTVKLTKSCLENLWQKCQTQKRTEFKGQERFCKHLQFWSYRTLLHIFISSVFVVVLSLCRHLGSVLFHDFDQTYFENPRIISGFIKDKFLNEAEKICRSGDGREVKAAPRVRTEGELKSSCRLSGWRSCRDLKEQQVEFCS